MPVPRWVARANRVGFNRLFAFVAPWTPGFGLVIHRGRKSGRIYRTPVCVFPRDDDYVISLMYGSGTDWVKNVLAAGGCELETRRQRFELVAPKLYRDETARDMPAFVRFVLTKVLQAPEFMALKAVR